MLFLPARCFGNEYLSKSMGNTSIKSRLHLNESLLKLFCKWQEGMCICCFNSLTPPSHFRYFFFSISESIMRSFHLYIYRCYGTMLVKLPTICFQFCIHYQLFVITPTTGVVRNPEILILVVGIHVLRMNIFLIFVLTFWLYQL